MSAQELRVLYEDNHVLAVEKPVNVPCQADVSGDTDLLTLGKAWIRQKYQKPGAVYLGLVHRLDRPVGGAMVFAKTSKAAARLSEQIREKETGKTYFAIVKGSAPKQMRLEDYLIKDARTNTSRVCGKNEGGKYAALAFECMGCAQGLSLIKVKLETGRSHQIRVQMAHAGLPLWGDNRYGGGKPGQQIALWCAQMQVSHPTKKTLLTVNCPPPQGFPWSLFEMPGWVYAQSALEDGE